MYQTLDPFHQKNLKSYSAHSYNEATRVLSNLQKTQTPWQQLEVQERAKHIHKIADEILKNKEAWALLASQEMGKPVSQARSEIDKSIRALKGIPDLSFEILNSTKRLNADVYPENYGVVLSIQPWNFPFWQVLRMAACAWITGHTVLLKHSEIVSGCAQALESVCHWQGQKLLSHIRTSSKDLHSLIENEKSLGLVTFTGSTFVGKLVAETCGRSLKKSILELGGNDAYFVMPDSDLELAVQKCVQTRLINSGQSCVAGKRFYLHGQIKQEFIKLFHEQLQKVVRGNPAESRTEVGPAAHPRLIQAVHVQIQKAVKQGAKYTEVWPFKDQFSAIGTLDFGPSLRAFESEEIFAPVALFYEFSDVDLAVDAVNQGPYGLAGGIFTADLGLAEKVAKASQVGTFTINGFSQSDPLLPFGGTKNSGYGREMGREGIHEFVQWKVVRHG